MEPERTPARVGRYLLFEEIARGGMASVHVGRLEGPAGFKRTVAVKRLHPTLGRDPEFLNLFLDEARIAARIEHPNVVPVLDVVSVDAEVLLVMEYVHGESLAELLYESQRAGERPPLRIVAQIMVNVLTGLHAAHETCDESGAALQIVHRDVSPHNIMVSADGIARLVDFGIARAERRSSATTQEGHVRGKLAYMAPEQLDEVSHVDRKADVYAAALVFWEAVVGRRAFDQDASVIITKKLTGEVSPPRQSVPNLPVDIDAIIVRGMTREQAKRFPTALEMARAIEAAMPPVSPREIAEWVSALAGPKLRARASVVAASGNAQAAPAAREDAPAAEYVATSELVLPTKSAFSKRSALVVGALLVAVAVGTCVAVARPGAGPVVTAQASASLPVAPATASIPLPEPASSVVPSASIPAPLAAEGAAAAPAPAVSVKRKTKAGTSKTKRPECDPPWHVDDHGVRILKKECF